MQEFGFGQFGKMLIVLGLIIATIGIFMLGLSKLGLFRLPGDIEFGGKNWRVFIPIASCIVISVILSLILWLLRNFRK